MIYYVCVLEKALGDFSWAFLLNRVLYSIFGDIYYALLQKYKELGKRSAVVPRWAGAREELRRAAFLLPFATVMTGRDTASALFVSDAEGANARDLGGGAGGTIGGALTGGELRVGGALVGG